MAIRARVLRTEPRCVLCLAAGRAEPATEVDHVVPLFKGGADGGRQGDDSNYQSLCSTHHLEKTIAERGFGVKQAVGLDGYPIGDDAI